MLDTPVLFLIYKRPDTTARVFEQIRKVQPKQLFVVADGPKDIPGEKEACDEARKIATNVDWDCEVTTNFSDKNMGCRDRVSSGITWFFEHVEEGIILEDDTVPDLSFFGFCRKMLWEFKNDERIGQISAMNFGYNFNHDKINDFSFFGGIWGWATWKKSWRYYNEDITGWNSYLNKLRIFLILKSNLLYSQRKKYYDKLLYGKLDSWAYIWSYNRIHNKLFSVIPHVNLIKNIGDDQATHKKSTKHGLFDQIYSVDFEKKVNKIVKHNKRYDIEFVKKFF